MQWHLQLSTRGCTSSTTKHQLHYELVAGAQTRPAPTPYEEHTCFAVAWFTGLLLLCQQPCCLYDKVLAIHTVFGRLLTLITQPLERLCGFCCWLRNSMAAFLVLLLKMRGVAGLHPCGHRQDKLLDLYRPNFVVCFSHAKSEPAECQAAAAVMPGLLAA
jgi:hypothetical protein